MAAETSNVKSQRGEDIPPLKVRDIGPLNSARHIIFYRSDALSYDMRRELEEAPASARLSMAEPWLDAGQGECGLTDDKTATDLSFAIRTTGDQYDLLAWCIMPSHVHVLIVQHPNADLTTIVRRWMDSAELSQTPRSREVPLVWDTRIFADAGNGEAWVAAVTRHIEGNPVTAGLASSPGAWRWSSASRELARFRTRQRPTRPAQPPPRRQPAPVVPTLSSDPTRRATHVVFWLNDAVSGSVRRGLTRLASAGRLPVLDKALDKALDNGRGRRSLAVRRAAVQVRTEILAGDGSRYGLIAWCVMPTHVHVLLSEMRESALADVVARWKAKTVDAANIRRLFRIDASPWAMAYTSTELVGSEDIEDVRSYVEHNPVIARLARSPQTWPWSSASEPLRKAAPS